MTYKVTFRKRFNAEAQPADDPHSFVRPADGVILGAEMAEQIDPPALHSQDTLDEDDNFESLGTEVWEYEIADSREQEFLDALKNSRMAIDYERIDDVVM